ncbi:MAG: uroporphyrinogen decarboxylase family protein [Pirellulales bacterium]
MNDGQWNTLCDLVCRGAIPADPVTGFIIDSPWLPNWHGVSIADYLAHDEVWFEANREAVEAFPSTIFLPGFWAEYGMCTEPSAFGTRCVFPENEFPFAHPVIQEIEQVDRLAEPDPATDGLLPFVLKRLKWAQPRLRDMGHAIRFSVSRGPLNIASFLMGSTEFLMAIKTDPGRMHRLLEMTTAFLKKWHLLQQRAFPTIEGMMVLDDIVGFIGEADFREFALPYLKELYAVDVPVKFFHNDADCAASARYYPEIGINLYNPGIQHTIAQIQQWTGPRTTILGSIPPRDVLASGTPEDVTRAVREQRRSLPAQTRVVLSCAGGMPPGVSTENLLAFLEAARGC